MFHFPNKQKTFGLDISDFSLKIAQVEKHSDGFLILALLDEKIPSGFIEKGEVKQKQGLAELIQKSFKKITGKAFIKATIVCSLPEEKSFLDVLQLPLCEQENELLSMVKAEAESRIPFPLSEVYFDFEKIAQAPNATQQEVLLAACPKSVVDVYAQVLSLTGLKTKAMEIESIALSRALFKRGAVSNPILVIDLGATRASFVMYAGQNVRFTSTIPVASLELSRNIANVSHLSFSEAEKLKVKEGLIGRKKAQEAMTPLLTDLAEQIKNHLSYYQTHGSKTKFSYVNHPLEKIALCGGGANLKGLPEFLSQELKMRVELGNPLVNISKEQTHSKFKLSKREALSYTTALGLAQRQDNVN